MNFYSVKADGSSPDTRLLGELVAAVCHRGDMNAGHYVCYSQVAGRWYLNNDTRPCRPTSNPLLQRHAGETVDLLFFQNSEN